EGDRWPGRRRGGAPGDPSGLASHAGEQERGGATPPSGLQDPTPQDKALRYRGRSVPGVVTGSQPAMASAPWCWRHSSSIGTDFSASQSPSFGATVVPPDQPPPGISLASTAT